METIGFVGGGNMAEAIIKGTISANVYSPDSIFVSDIRLQRLSFLAKRYHIQSADDNAALADKVNILVLSVKPQDMTEALQSIKDAVKPDTLVISIMAGKRTSDIAAVLGDRPIVRVMPNTPALIGEGASALFANEKGPAQLRQKVTSPGGTTEAALKVLQEGKFASLIEAALKKACQRSRELSK